jgi:hypothetical protein
MSAKKEPTIPFSVKLCSDRAAFEVRIRKKISFDMVKLESLLKSNRENQIIVSTPHILIFRTKGAEITLSRNGRMLVKRVRSDKEAATVASEVLSVVSKVLL